MGPQDLVDRLYVDRKGESVIQGLPDAGGAASSSSSSIGLTDPFFSSSSSPLLTQGRAGEEEMFFPGDEGRRTKIRSKKGKGLMSG